MDTLIDMQCMQNSEIIREFCWSSSGLFVLDALGVLSEEWNHTPPKQTAHLFSKMPYPPWN